MVDPLIHTRTLPQVRAGLLAGVGAYLCWGVFPLYFHVLITRGVDAAHLLAYRITWSAVFVALLLTASCQWAEVITCLRSRRVLWGLLASTLLIAINWWVYIYSVASRQVSYSALGYYMNPLVSVLLGVVILRERLRAL
ncbi:MAG: EamA family transporter, partial [Phycisphaerae bacterium]|nr:EamA family transporter [Phycisphaerae bacterium]